MKIPLLLLILSASSLVSAQIVDHKTLALWNYQVNAADNYDAILCSASVKPSQSFYQAIRSVHMSKEITDARYRFTLGKEIYTETSAAELRIKEIVEPKQKGSLYSKLCNIRQAFQSGKTVYFVHTDVGAYRSELQNITQMLSATVVDESL